MISTLVAGLLGVFVHAADAPPAATGDEPVATVTQRPTGERVAPRHLRFSTPEEKRHWEEAVDALWNTPLGQLYGEYLFSPTPDHADLPLWARLLAQRLFEQPNFLTLRISALQVMTEDLYVREKMTSDVSDRVMILGLHLQQKESLNQQNLRYQTAFVVAPIVLTAIPFGSRAFRRETRKLIGAGVAKVRGKRIHPFRRPRLKRAVTNFGESYSISQAANALGIELWALTAGVYLYNDWLYGSRWAPMDKALLAGLDDLVRAMERPGSPNLTLRPLQR